MSRPANASKVDVLIVSTLEAKDKMMILGRAMKECSQF
jgi:hypothetical protein